MVKSFELCFHFFFCFWFFWSHSGSQDELFWSWNGTLFCSFGVSFQRIPWEERLKRYFVSFTVVMLLFVISSSDELLVPRLVVKNDLMLGNLSLTICYPFPCKVVNQMANCYVKKINLYMDAKKCIWILLY